MEAMGDADRRRAGLYLGAVNLKIIKAVARRRHHLDNAAPGARLPLALAGGALELRRLSEPRPGGKVAPITPLGYKTAVRALPRLLGALGDADPRRRAAIMLADTVERIGSIKGIDLAGTDAKAGISDGGATTKIKHVARWRLVEALANGWEVERGGRVRRGPERALMPVQRQNGKRYEIKAMAALWAVCVEGQALDGVLMRHGWRVHSETRRTLGQAVLAALDDVAGGLGLGRWNDEKP